MNSLATTVALVAVFSAAIIYGTDLFSARSSCALPRPTPLPPPWPT
jgi:hypothetical protein